jgi:hypothetical protein
LRIWFNKFEVIYPKNCRLSGIEHESRLASLIIFIPFPWFFVEITKLITNANFKACDDPIHQKKIL